MRRYVSHYGIPAVCLICFSLQYIIRSSRSLRMTGNAVVKVVTRASTSSTTTTHNNTSTTKLPLYLITPTNRPYLLNRSIFYVMPLRDCWDLHWVIIHSLHNHHPTNETERLHPHPLFGNVFDWITELVAHDNTSHYGNHERNVGIEHVLSHAAQHNHTHRGLVYFLDDDNTLSMDTCRTDVQDVLQSQSSQQQPPPIYYANQYWCSGKRKIQTRGYPRLFSKLHYSNHNHNKRRSTKRTTLVRATDTGTWLIPVWLLQQVYRRPPPPPNSHNNNNDDHSEKNGIHWQLPEYSADGLFFTELVSYVLTMDGGRTDRLVRLNDDVIFHYNRLQAPGGPCRTPRWWWWW